MEVACSFLRKTLAPESWENASEYSTGEREILPRYMERCRGSKKRLMGGLIDIGKMGVWSRSADKAASEIQGKT